MLNLNPKYKSLIQHEGRYFIITGGRGSGKSYAASCYLIMLTFEPGHIIAYTRLTMVSAGISIIPELVRMIASMGLESKFIVFKNKIQNKQSGSSIIFLGLKTASGDNTAKFKSIAGLTTLVVEESEELRDEELFDKINLSIRTLDIQNRVILILNPTTKSHFIYTKFFELKGVNPGHNGIVGDTAYIHTTYLDNPHLSEDFLQEIEFMKHNNNDKFVHTVMGGWLAKANGVVFTDFELKVFPSDVDVEYGADWGYSNDPSTLVAVHIDNKNRKIYVKQLLYQKGLNTHQLTRSFKAFCGNNLIVGDSSEGRLIDEMHSSGLNIIRCKKGAGSVKEGIMLMKNYTIMVDPGSKDLIEELNNYAWRADSDQPIDKWNHAIDALRYIVSHQLKSSSSEWRIY